MSIASNTADLDSGKNPFLEDGASPAWVAISNFCFEHVSKLREAAAQRRGAKTACAGVIGFDSSYFSKLNNGYNSVSDGVIWKLAGLLEKETRAARGAGSAVVDTHFYVFNNKRGHHMRELPVTRREQIACYLFLLRTRADESLRASK